MFGAARAERRQCDHEQPEQHDHVGRAQAVTGEHRRRAVVDEEPRAKLEETNTDGS